MKYRAIAVDLLMLHAAFFNNLNYYVCIERLTEVLKTFSAGPVISIWPELWSQSITRMPPESRTDTGQAASPRETSANAAAQAPVPQARVSPTPRSQVRCVMCPGVSRLTNSMFALSDQYG